MSDPHAGSKWPMWCESCGEKTVHYLYHSGECVCAECNEQRDTESPMSNGQWTLVDGRGVTRDFDTEGAAKEQKRELESLNDVDMDLVVRAPDEPPAPPGVDLDSYESGAEEDADADGDADTEPTPTATVAEEGESASETDGGSSPEVVPADAPAGGDESASTRERLPESPPVDEDPLTFMPEHFVDTIEGTPTINRKGYAVIAERYNVSVVPEPITLPSETGFEYAEWRAVATNEDGREYGGFGSAHVDRGDDKTLLGEMAETRAMKRATAWATGIGITAIEELQSAGDANE